MGHPLKRKRVLFGPGKPGRKPLAWGTEAERDTPEQAAAKAAQIAEFAHRVGVQKIMAKDGGWKCKRVKT